MKGRIHSIETFGTVDGPGIRFVLFMQGCALRCQYCHNADTWNPSEGRQVSVDEVLAEVESYLPYYQLSGGGITVSGGEPTLQTPFVTELFRQCKERWGLHTTLDSSGFCEVEQKRELLKWTDLVLLDLKMIDPKKHLALTGQPNERILTFARTLSEQGKNFWVRHVLVPGVTDSEEDLIALGKFIGQLNGVQRVEVLPYHQMGIYKWKLQGLEYPLEGVKPPSEQEVERAYRLIAIGKGEGVASL